MVYMIKEKLKLVPGKPGCYLMKDKNGIIIYVGKAKNLKNRLSSYFTGKHSGKTAIMISKIADFEYIITNSELEAFILEFTLIKKHDPKYNIIFRDDKTYPYIEFDMDLKAPKLTVVRRIPSKKKPRNIRYYGPYPNVQAARKTVDILNRTYPLRKCNTFQKEPCLYYHLNQCLGYCKKEFSVYRVKDMIANITKFFNGYHVTVTERLKMQMEKASSSFQYEKAGEIKELLDYVNLTLRKQKVILKDNSECDIFGYYIENGYLSAQVFFIRNGKLVEHYGKIIQLIDTPRDEMNRFIINFYNHNKYKPKEILVPMFLNAPLLEELLETTVRTPKRGDKQKLMLLASDNAKNNLREQLTLLIRKETTKQKALVELQEKLGIDHIDRIELFDNSNLFGTHNVSGMVVFIDGIPAKNQYRKFKISQDKNDDYGTMREVIYRRYFRVLKENGEFPDLILVDGGLGQMNVAREVIDSLGLEIPVAGLKKDDKHATACLMGLHNEMIDIDKHSELFLLLTRMQDEVHNYTIHYHQQIRSKSNVSSLLDNVRGIGDSRKKALLKEFGNLQAIMEAPLEEVSKIVPVTTAKNLQNYLRQTLNKKKES